jgi:Bacterial toxin homologue of phage lysozyme, C-term
MPRPAQSRVPTEGLNDLRNQQIDAMAHPFREFRGGSDRWVLYPGSLPPSWRPLLWTASSQNVAAAAIQNAARSGFTPAEFRRLARRFAQVDERTSDDEVGTILARGIVSRQLLVIRKDREIPVQPASDAVFAAINARYGTQVNFTFLGAVEGGQRLYGYVPTSGGVVAQISGMTIATGFDIGQFSVREISGFGFMSDVAQRLLPFADTNYEGKSAATVLAEIVALRVPVPALTRAEAENVDELVKGAFVGAAAGKWNEARHAGVPAFAQLPIPWQTVIVSRFFQQGRYVNLARTPIRGFGNAATQGQWDAAATALSVAPVGADWYRTRVQREARYLLTQMPPPLQPPRAVPTRRLSPPRP